MSQIVWCEEHHAWKTRAMREAELKEQAERPRVIDGELWYSQSYVDRLRREKS